MICFGPLKFSWLIYLGKRFKRWWRIAPFAILSFERKCGKAKSQTHPGMIWSNSRNLHQGLIWPRKLVIMYHRCYSIWRQWSIIAEGTILCPKGPIKWMRCWEAFYTNIDSVLVARSKCAQENERLYWILTLVSLLELPEGILISSPNYICIEMASSICKSTSISLPIFLKILKECPLT